MSNPQKRTLLWWVIPEVLAGMQMPFIHPERRLNSGGKLNAYEDELPELYSDGVRAVVSLLNIPSDAAVFESAGFTFSVFPFPDGGPSTLDQVTEFIRFVNEQRKAQRAIAVHCVEGLGRTGTMLAVYLITNGHSADAAILRDPRSGEARDPDFEPDSVLGGIRTTNPAVSPAVGRDERIEKARIDYDELRCRRMFNLMGRFRPSFPWCASGRWSWMKRWTGRSTGARVRLRTGSSRKPWP